jgi:transposase
MPTASPKPLG